MASNRTKCKLDKGPIVPYHAAAQIGTGEVYDPQVFEYMGTGVVFSVGDMPQWSITRLRFYKLRSDRPRWAR